MGLGQSRTGRKDERICRLRGSYRHADVEKMFSQSQAGVLVDVAKSWPCQQWDEEWLSNTLGHHIVQVSDKDSCGNVKHREKKELSSFMSQCKDLGPSRRHAGDGTLPYVDNFDVFSLAPELRSGVPSEKLFGPDRGLIIYGGFLGPPGSSTRIHFDSEDNIITCVFGRKLFVLAPPGAVDLMDHSARDIPLENPWDPHIEAVAKQHPMFARCKESVQVAILGPGDVLVQPRGWSHWVYNLELSFSVPCWAKVLPSMD